MNKDFAYLWKTSRSVEGEIFRGKEGLYVWIVDKKVDRYLGVFSD